MHLDVMSRLTELAMNDVEIFVFNCSSASTSCDAGLLCGARAGGRVRPCGAIERVGILLPDKPNLAVRSRKICNCWTLPVSPHACVRPFDEVFSCLFGGDYSAADAAARTADGLGEVIIFIYMDHQRGTIVVEHFAVTLIQHQQVCV